MVLNTYITLSSNFFGFLFEALVLVGRAGTCLDVDGTPGGNAAGGIFFLAYNNQFAYGY